MKNLGTCTQVLHSLIATYLVAQENAAGWLVKMLQSDPQDKDCPMLISVIIPDTHKLL
jgi:hypothetical protein